MNQENFEKASEIIKKISIVDSYIRSFDPKNNIVWLQTRDHHGNQGKILKLYAHENEASIAIGKYDNFSKHYKEFLQKCIDDLEIRKQELQIEFNKL